ncbi:hypothetical protein, partial [Bradyrhizobium sp.]|uniref:hypothetical protein n=1 Tax=Bradyrhizobium sp. TaxID=376 RepID=UPI003C7DA5B6
HSNDDFESMGLPSYQHLRPSMSRQDQYPCGVVGIETLHCCFPSAAAIHIKERVTERAQQTIDEVSLIIGAPQHRFVAGVGLQRRPNRAVRKLPPTCQG